MKKKTIVHILGSGHCGSTILDLVLNGHSQISGLGELNMFLTQEGFEGEKLCSCGKSSKNCSFWSKISFENITARYGRSYFASNLYNWVGQQHLSHNERLQIEDLRDLYRQIFSISNANVIVDSSKDSYRAKIIANNITEYNHVFVHIVRDVRAVYYSYYRKYKKFFHPVFFWSFANVKIELLRNSSNANYLYLSYERFVTHPKKELSLILSTLDLSFEEEMLKFGSKHHLIGGNRLRFAKIKGILDKQEWKKKLTFAQKFVCLCFAGLLNIYYRYTKF